MTLFSELYFLQIPTLYKSFTQKLKRQSRNMQEPPVPTLSSISQQIARLKLELVDILVHNKSGVNLSHKLLRDAIYKYISSSPRPTIADKTKISRQIRQNIRDFISEYIGPKVKNMIERNDPYYFVQTMNQLWANFQRFIFAHEFIVEKLKQFFEQFYKMSNAKQFQYGGNQVVSVPIMAVNQLRIHFEGSNNDKVNIFKTFPKHFSNFIARQRQGTSVPRQMLKQTVAAIQSCFFDFQAFVQLDSNRKPSIIKNTKVIQNLARKSKDSTYFQENIMNTVISDCEMFYKNLVHQKSPKLTPTDEIDLISKILNQEQSRSTFYIHTPQNQKKYVETVDRTLIGLDLTSRIKKEDGFIKYLRDYQPDKEDYKNQLIKFWKIYSRIVYTSLPEILKIYSQYLDEEAVIAEQKIQKFGDFVPQMIRINTKNIQIVSFFGVNFQLQNKRNEKIRGMLSNQIVKNSKFKGKHTMGATNLAQFVNTKFKEIYAKGDEGLKQTIINLTLLFKILQQKVHFTKQHQKHIANRLLEDIDFSKDNEYTNIINLEKGFIEEMQKQMGVSQVKQLLQNIKDIEKSVDHTKKMKQKLSNKVHVLNQIIIKSNTFWPEKNTYDVSPPSALLRMANEVQSYFSKTSNIQFQFNNGVSMFRGQFKSKVPKQNFLLKNIYLIILLILDESQGKKMLYGDIKSRIKSYGSKKEKGNLELSKNLIELLHNGLVLSSTRTLSKEDPKCIKLTQSDQFQLNRQFDLEEQLKKNKVPPKMIKKLPVIKMSNIVMIPDWLKKMFIQQSNQLAQDEILIEKQRRLRVKQISVKCLKHAHHSNKDCSFEQLFKQYDIAKNKQYRVTQKYLKQVLQQLINDEYCERVEGQRNVFKYKA